VPLGKTGRTRDGRPSHVGEHEEVVRRFFEEMCNGRRNELAPELFTADYRMHDPQVPGVEGPEGMAAAVKTYQDGVNGHWQIEEVGSQS